MLHKFLKLLNRCKSLAEYTYSIWDLTELLHHPWHTQELWFIVAVLSWVGIVKFSLFVFIQFGGVLPSVFNKTNSKFILWLLYITLAVIGVSNLVCNYFHHKPLEMLYFKAIVTVVALVYDWRETRDAIKKYKATIDE